MIKVSDYLAKRVSELGVRHVFMLTGGGAMHLNDAIGRRKDLQFVCNHHEQASAIAAEGYARITGDVGVVVVTSGPGGTNTITGLLGQWLDSIPALYISGQVRYDTTAGSTGLPLRQLGDQEADIVSIVKSITKYAVLITDPLSIRYHFDKAVHLARSGRPGPVWLDIPLNVQASLVDESLLTAYDARENQIDFDEASVSRQVAEVIERIKQAKRPVFLAGNGIRLGHAVDLFHTVIDLLGIPVQTAIGAHDLIYTDHDLFFGRPSITGDRSSNFIIQNCDLLLSVGSRLGVRQISYNYEAFARGAFKIVVDIDPFELSKPTVRPDLAVNCDAKMWLGELARQLEKRPLRRKTDWLEWCCERRRRYPSVLPEYADGGGYVNSYYFVQRLSTMLAPNDTIVLANATANTCTFQAIELKPGQRLFTNSGCASMGYDLPAAIGACFANDKGRVICIAGDGSIQLNIQELQTIVHHKLPIKIFVLSNDGYLAIRMTQDTYFPDHQVGSSGATGVTCPDIVKIAQAYCIPAFRMIDNSDVERIIREVLNTSGPVICDICMSPNQSLYPKVSSEKRPDGSLVSKPMEDMYPFLDRSEFLENMIIPVWEPNS